MTTPKFLIAIDGTLTKDGESVAPVPMRHVFDLADILDRANAFPALYAALEETANDCCDIRIALQSPVMTASEKLAMIQKLVDKSRDARQSALALARGEKGESK